jgi:hypothetical protein
MILAVIVLVTTAETALARPKKGRVDRGSAKGTEGASANHSARQQHLDAAGPRTQHAVDHRFPGLCECLQTAANQSFSDRVTQRIHSFSAQRGSRRQANKDFYVRSCANN